MADDNNKDAQTELIVKLVDIMQRFQPGGDHGPIEDRNEWDKLIASREPGERELLQELTNFCDLSKFLAEHNQSLEAGIITSLEQVHKLAIPERILRLREINQQLMQQVACVGEDRQLRN